MYPSLDAYLIKYVCPVCDKHVRLLSQTEFDLHVNQCLDRAVGGSEWDAVLDEGVIQDPFRPALSTNSNNMKSLDTHAKSVENLGKSHAQNNGTGLKSKTCPFYKWIPDTTFTVDAFRFGAIPGCTAYFLTHFHADHYMGLSGQFVHGPIYMTEITRKLVRLQFPRVREDLLISLPPVSFVQDVQVTVLDANHCPGSAMFLFVTKCGKRHLHVGDFRAHSGMLLEPALQFPLDSLFLDTTYLDASHTFPSQKAVLDVTAELARRLATNEDLIVGRRQSSRQTASSSCFRVGSIRTSDRYLPNHFQFAPHLHMNKIFSDRVDRLLVIVGSYTVGKEKMFMAIAEALDCKVYCEKKKWRIYETYEDPQMNNRRTDDPFVGQVHVVPMRTAQARSAEQYFEPYKSSFSHMLVIKPTGWTFTDKVQQKVPSGQRSVKDMWNNCRSTKRQEQEMEASTMYLSDLTPQWVSQRIAVFGVGYSEHSSYTDLRDFVCGLNIKRIIPTVNVGTSTSRAKMAKYLDMWQNKI